MRITPAIFDAFLKCATKCHLRSLGEIGSGNEYAEWVRDRDESYQREAALRMQEAAPETERADGPHATENLKAAKWRLAVDLLAQTPDRSADCQPLEPGPNEGTGGLVGPRSEQLLESHLHAVERVPSEGRGKPAQFIPIRFVFRNKLTKDDRLLLAFDALVLSQVLGREVGLGRIIHGDDHVALEVKTSALTGEVQKRLDKVAALLSSTAPPDLVLNRHCAECEFKARCRKIAVEKDDLSLLAGMNAKERQKLRSKGVFTVNQLSYTFLPRRRPKWLREKREKYHHSLKALAIREKKIHIVGSPGLKIEGTPVYLDVEGLPDSDFYYLIGMRIGNGESAVQHSLWADSVEDEVKIWREFLGILETVEKPVLIHYGSYETDFLEAMGNCYAVPGQAGPNGVENQTAVNILSVVLGQIYFPTFSNGLKDVASWLGFAWPNESPIGVISVACRRGWERSRDSSLKDRLVAYNAADCRAAELVTQALLRLNTPETWSGGNSDQPTDAVYVESLRGKEWKIGHFVSPFKEFEQINLAAWWNYQRDRIYVKSTKPRCANLRSSRRKRIKWKRYIRINKTIVCPELSSCPVCGGDCKERARCSRVLYDLSFGRSSIKRWVVKYQFRHYWCCNCRMRVGEPHEFWPQSHWGRDLVAYVLSQTFDLGVPFLTVQKNLSRFFRLDMGVVTLTLMKRTAAQQYKGAYEAIFHKLVTGTLLHVDETQVSIRGKTAYVWVFTNLYDVAYMYSDSREGGFLPEMLKDFTGVLVSDFFTAYDSVNCEQQKCLIHLMRDLNDDVLKHPYDEELKVIVRDFAALLKPIVETISFTGLKGRFLRKYRVDVNRFYGRLAKYDCLSERAAKCRQRFEKHREKLFTFLDHDGVPWNNNNAEHAVRAFAKLRDIVRGSFTKDSVRDFLIVLSICQTCKYYGLDFLDFLRSGEKDINAFAESLRGRKRRTQPLSG